jgi:hypothetical protein
VLFVDENTGGIDVVMHPTDRQTLFAAMWQLEMHTWGRESGGPGSGLYVSHDGGTKWTKLQGNGLPTHTDRKDRARNRAVESEPCLCADRNRRRRSVSRPAHGQR